MNKPSENQSRQSFGDISLDRMLLIENLRDRFQTEWQSGNSPSLDDFLTEVSPPELGLLLAELMPVEIHHRLERGDRVSREEYCKRFPKWESVITSSFQRHDGQAGIVSGSQAIQESTRIGDDDAAFISTHIYQSNSDESESKVLNGTECFGNYRLCQELGRGGMGIVYKAEQVSAGNRVVALKVIRSDRLGSENDPQRQVAIERFRVEAKAAAKLHHDHIVTVYEAGEVDGQPYYSMRYVDGTSLRALVKGKPMKNKLAARMIRDVAMGIHAAHQHGILHRDLKPDNILVDKKTGRAMVADFGLAKLIEDEGLTQAGDWFGTPAYMPPEQFSDVANVTIASDVYSIGATLYHLLTARPPFKGKQLALLKQAKDVAPAPPSQINPACDADLETLCLKCLEKEPHLRIASADQLAEELERYLRDEPIHARPVSRFESMWRWCRRNPVVSTLVATVLLVLVVGIISTSTFAMIAQRRADEKSELLDQSERDRRRANGAEALAYFDALASDLERIKSVRLVNEKSELLKQSERDRRRANGSEALAYFDALVSNLERVRSERLAEQERIAREDAERESYRAQVSQVAAHLDANQNGQASEILNRVPYQRRGWDHRHLQRRMLGTPLSIEIGSHQTQFADVAFSPDGKRIVHDIWGGGLSIVDVSTGKRTGWIPNIGVVNSFAMSPNGEHVLVGRYDGQLILWNVDTSKKVATFKGHTKQVLSVSFSPDGKLVSSGSSDGTARIWDANTAESLHVIRPKVQLKVGQLDLPVYDVAFSPVSRTIVTARGQIDIWDVKSGKHLVTFENTDERSTPYTKLAFHPEGRRLAATIGNDLHIFNVFTEQKIATVQGHSERLECVAYSPDGSLLASGGKDNVIRVWSTSRPRPARFTFRAHSDTVLALDFNPDGRRLLSRSYDGTLKVWNVENGSDSLVFEGHQESVEDVACSPNGKLIASACGDGVIKVWEASTGREKVALGKRARRGGSFAIAGGRRRVTSGAGLASCIAFRPDGQQLASGYDDGVIKVWEANTGREVIATMGHEAMIFDLDYTPDGQHIVSGSIDGIIKVWEADKASECLCIDINASIENTKPRHESVTGVAMNPKGGSFVGGGSTGTLKVWDPRTGKEIFAARNKVPVECVAFNPNGQEFASGHRDGSVIRWNAATGERLQTYSGHSKFVSDVSYSPDGQLIVSCSYDRTIKIWDRDTERERYTLRENGMDISSVAFSPDGNRLVSGTCHLGDPGFVRIWDARVTDEEFLCLKPRDLRSLLLSLHEEWAVRNPVPGDPRLIFRTLNHPELDLENLSVNFRAFSVSPSSQPGVPGKSGPFTVAPSGQYLRILRKDESYDPWIEDDNWRKATAASYHTKSLEAARAGEKTFAIQFHQARLSKGNLEQLVVWE